MSARVSLIVIARPSHTRLAVYRGAGGLTYLSRNQMHAGQMPGEDTVVTVSDTRTLKRI